MSALLKQFIFSLVFAVSLLSSFLQAIAQPCGPVSITTTSPVLCAGSENITLTANTSGGTPPYTYQWNTGGTTSSIVVGTGVWTVTITGCGSATITLTDNPIINVSSAQNNVSCNSLCDGSAFVSVSGGTPGYTYNWSPSGGSTAITTGLCAGNHTLVVTDAVGCTDTSFFTITQPPPLTLSLSQTNVLCNGGSNGNATVIPSGGTPPFMYLWSNGQNTSTATGLAAGNYTVTITDDNGCIASQSVTITQPPLLASTATQTNVSCNGSNDGTATVTAAGGSPPYSYLWSNGATTSQITNLTSQTYSVTITDANGCTTTNTFSITQPPVLTSTATQTNVVCNGGNNGTATVAAAGGSPPYTYLWSNGGTTSQISNLTSQIYSVTITDANGCTTTNTFSITQPPLFTATATQTNVSCNGGADGTASALVSGGGNPPFTYSWNPGGQTSQTATGLSAGTYSVIITDASGCTVNTTVSITQPTPISVITSSVSENCNQGNGSATVSPSGGTPNYTYLWGNGQSTQIATGLSAGTYSVIITDANGCTSVQAVTVGNISPGTASITSSVNVSCNAGSNGSASAGITGGNAPFTYSWTGGQSTQTATGLSAGTYTITVTDADGCTSSATVNITQPTAIAVPPPSSVPENCNQGNGSATASPSGGTPNYTYLWGNGQITQTATGLSAGTYTVVVTDANGCTAVTSVTVVNIPAGTASITSFTNVSCNGGNNGSASASISGGNPSFTYSWNPGGQTSQTATGLSAGTYTITVTDADGCTSSATVNITQPTPISVITSSVSENCNQGNGTATASPSGGTPNYTYLWSNAQSTQTATGLSAGNYTVIITDANGCTSVQAVTVGNIPAGTASITSSTNVSCNGGSNGSASAGIIGGNAPFTYLWNPGGQPSQTAIGLSAGTYSVTVTDADGCTSSATVNITQPSALSVTITSAGNTNCTSPNGSATATVSGGTSPYIYVWNTFPAQTGATATGLSAGNYSVIITDGNGCTSTGTVTITAPVPPVITITITGNTPICPGDNVTLTASGAVVYSWSWGPTTTAVTVSPSVTTTYTLLAVDANGCSNTASVTVTVFPPVVAVIVGDTILCVGDVENLTASGGTTYLWNTGATSQSISVSAAGTYWVIVSVGGCNSDTASVTVVVNPLPVANAGADVTIDYGSGTQLSGTGGTAYSWTPASGLGCTLCPNPIASPGSTTDYIVFVADANGCTDTDTVNVFVDEECGTPYLPNAFSPNGDGENDSLRIYINNMNCITDFRIMIFNRWGEKVFQSADKYFRWDGDCESGILHGEQGSAVFVYRLRVEMKKQEMIHRKGNVSLFR